MEKLLNPFWVNLFSASFAQPSKPKSGVRRAYSLDAAAFTTIFEREDGLVEMVPVKSGGSD
jgi:hypothetical protein